LCLQLSGQLLCLMSLLLLLLLLQAHCLSLYMIGLTS
jgi:hypothetical protein